MAPELKLPITSHFTGRLTYRGTDRFRYIKAKFTEMDLVETVKASPFGHFWEAGELTFAGALVHSLLLRKMKVDTEKEDEVWFHVGRNDMRFGRIEFELITGLPMGSAPTDEEIHAKSNDYLVRTYFEGKSSVQLDSLMLQLERCEDKDDAYKLGLIAFIEGVLVSKEGNVQVLPEMLKFVNDLEFFFKYPWGERAFRKLMETLGKNMQHYKDNVDKKKGKKIAQEAKYTVSGYVPAFQYWAYEAIEKLGKKYAHCNGTKFPRMLSWKTPEGQRKQDVKATDIALLFNSRLVVKKCLFPRPSEEAYFKSINEGKAPLCFEMDVEQTVDVDGTQESVFETQAKTINEAVTKANLVPPPPAPERLDSIEARLEKLESQQEAVMLAQTGLVNSHLSMRRSFTESQKDLKETLLAKMDELMAMVKGAPTPGEPTPAPQNEEQQASDNEDVFPEDWEADDNEAPSTPLEAIITAIGDTQSQDEVLLLPAPPENVPFVRKRKPPTYLNDYTAEKKEASSSRERRPGETSRPSEWLHDDHIDAISHLMRRRRHHFPESYPQPGVILDTTLPQFLIGIWSCQTGDKSTFEWPDAVNQYYLGMETRYMPSWKDLNFIYFVLYFDHQKHWVAVEVDIDMWQIRVYDNDLSCTTNAQFDAIMLPWTELFPHLLRSTGYYDQVNNNILNVDLGDSSQLRSMHARRMPSEVVPQSKTSGDCGVYALEYIEHLMLNRSLDNITDDSMRMFRDRWCVDLFYQNLTW
ncbi:uncharacterized protein LOC115713230 [Cannabis sativa]|uniref:uncharacterized protein LOC115713230 n=1 Tax=Cannabis sativa TaxID=3483 RepID=UPI0029CA016F|nr:uncharacterized protein LOC115713230 [Cannabis sativa]